MASFRGNLNKPVPECQIILDFAPRDDVVPMVTNITLTLQDAD